MQRKFVAIIVVLLLINIHSFSQNNSPSEGCFALKASDFQKTINGKNCSLFFLQNGQLKVAITNYGARIVSLCAPGRNGKMTDVVVGFKSIDDYLNAKGIYHGAVIGRVAGRIENGKMEVEGKSYDLPINSSPCHLHGGAKGFHSQVWDVSSVTDTSVVFTYLSIDGEMGYPGNLNVTATYRVSANSELSFEISATTDKSTPVNFTNHAFFNLAGEGSGSVLNHQLKIPAKYICAVNEKKLPNGQLLEVKNSPFDFRKPKSIGQDLTQEKTNDQLKFAGGYDHHFVIAKKKSNTIKLAAVLFDAPSGRKMEVFTNEPCIHIFSANFFNGADKDKLGQPINFRESIALETQRYPYLNNTKSFPSIILKPGMKYEAKTVYRFLFIK